MLGQHSGALVSLPAGFEVVALAAELSPGADGAPPTEFRIFRAGMNETSKGQFLFDEQAAKLVMDRFSREGVDMIADLEHLSLDSDSPSYDPDARAHFRLEVRAGELWACGVTWSPDGVRRLSEKTQRYISPVAARDPDTKRVLGIFNVGLVAQPATYHAQALVAASKRAPFAGQSLACKTLIAMLCKQLGKKI